MRREVIAIDNDTVGEYPDQVLAEFGDRFVPVAALQQHLLNLFARRDIIVRSDHANGLAFGISYGAADGMNPNIFAAGKAIAVFHIVGGVVFQMIVCAAYDPREILRTDMRCPQIFGILEIKVFCQFVLAPAEEALMPR